MCNWWDLSCNLSDAMAATADNVITQWVSATLESLSKTLITVGTLWTAVGTPTMEGAGSAVDFVRSHTSFFVLALTMMSIIIAGIQIAWTQRAEPLRELFRSLMTMVLTSALGVGVLQMGVVAADEFSMWILKDVIDGEDGRFMAKILGVGGLIGSNVGIIVLLIGGLVALIATLVQIALMFVRSAMLTLLAGVIPLAGAATNTKWGRAWLDKALGWTLAFLLYKPAASIIYAVAIKLIQGSSWSTFKDDDLTSFVLGIVMLVLATLALPALIAFMVPATTAMSSNGGAGAAAGAAAAATGAMHVTRSRGSGTSSAGSGGGGGAAGAASTGAASTGASASAGSAAALGPVAAVAGAVIGTAKKAQQGVQTTVESTSGSDSPSQSLSTSGSMSASGSDRSSGTGATGERGVDASAVTSSGAKATPPPPPSHSSSAPPRSRSTAPPPTRSTGAKEESA